ncbi:hypothetical protein HUU62_06000 [Rhodoferax sp. 4810]|uniref:Secreted protein n=1 Tax=Thiospirillum jenense TaxID=1653858 RepID=A0A839HAJ4_9GAMM|nr:hypothetical protein [Thiospirillum jenense]MBB1073965.1 hypothetical protein [Rhodoferax jenense]MBB1125841.1 hypothetical protein [Thiospirillum jenense]
MNKQINNYRWLQYGIPLIVAFASPNIALAYDTGDAERDCENHVRSEYGLTDIRETDAVQLMDSEKHYQVQGKTKIAGEKHRWTCEIKRRRVVNAHYRGPRPMAHPWRDERPNDERRGEPTIIPRRRGEVDIQMSGNCRLSYDRRGNLIGTEGRCSPQDRRRADQAAAAHFRERRSENEDRDWRDNRGWRDHTRNESPQIVTNRRGETEVTFNNGCVVYYDRAGRRQESSPQCRDYQVISADQASRRY